MVYMMMGAQSRVTLRCVMMLCTSLVVRAGTVLDSTTAIQRALASRNLGPAGSECLPIPYLGNGPCFPLETQQEQKEIGKVCVQVADDGWNFTFEITETDWTLESAQYWVGKTLEDYPQEDSFPKLQEFPVQSASFVGVKGWTHSIGVDANTLPCQGKRGIEFYGIAHVAIEDLSEIGKQDSAYGHTKYLAMRSVMGINTFYSYFTFDLMCECFQPSSEPSITPTTSPTGAPTVSSEPSAAPTKTPRGGSGGPPPSQSPSESPSESLSHSPSDSPSDDPITDLLYAPPPDPDPISKVKDESVVETTEKVASNVSEPVDVETLAAPTPPPVVQFVETHEVVVGSTFIVHNMAENSDEIHAEELNEVYRDFVRDLLFQLDVPMEDFDERRSLSQDLQQQYDDLQRKMNLDRRRRRLDVEYVPGSASVYKFLTSAECPDNVQSTGCASAYAHFSLDLVDDGVDSVCSDVTSTMQNFYDDGMLQFSAAAANTSYIIDTANVSYCMSTSDGQTTPIPRPLFSSPTEAPTSLAPTTSAPSTDLLTLVDEEGELEVWHIVFLAINLLLLCCLSFCIISLYCGQMKRANQTKALNKSIPPPLLVENY